MRKSPASPFVTLTLGFALAGALGCSGAASSQEATAGVEEGISCMSVSSCGGGGGPHGGLGCGTSGSECCSSTSGDYCLSGLVCDDTDTCVTAPSGPAFTSGVAWINTNGTCTSGETSPNGCDTNAHDYGYCTLTGSIAIPAALAGMGCTMGMTFGGLTDTWTPTNLFACTNFTATTGFSPLVGYEDACVGPIDAGYTLIAEANLNQSDGTGGTYYGDWHADAMPAGGPCLPAFP
jgi:hypothetical protein